MAGQAAGRVCTAPNHMFVFVLQNCTGVPQAVYNFWQYELCDVFIELMKPVMALDDAGTAGHYWYYWCCCVSSGCIPLCCACHRVVGHQATILGSPARHSHLLPAPAPP